MRGNHVHIFKNTTRIHRMNHKFRSLAAECEHEGQWELALENYQRAARLRAEWDQKDHEFLLKCIQRVQGKIS